MRDMFTGPDVTKPLDLYADAAAVFARTLKPGPWGRAELIAAYDEWSDLVEAPEMSSSSRLSRRLTALGFPRWRSGSRSGHTIRVPRREVWPCGPAVAGVVFTIGVLEAGGFSLELVSSTYRTLAGGGFIEAPKISDRFLAAILDYLAGRDAISPSTMTPDAEAASGA